MLIKSSMMKMNSTQTKGFPSFLVTIYPRNMLMVMV